MYDNICNLSSMETEQDGWVIYYNEPDKRTFYKQEEGMAYGSVITDNIIQHSLDKVLACYDNLEILDAFMPDFNDLKWGVRVTDMKGIMYGKQNFPWPMAVRDMAFTCSGFKDSKNKAVVSVSKSIAAGEKYFGHTILDSPEGLVRLKVKMGYNYF